MADFAPNDDAPAIIQYWHEKEPPDYVAECLESFRELNPDMRHRVFDEARAAEFIGEHFSPRELAAFRACAVPAMQADYFRYCAVLALGGVYADADFHCLKPLRPLIDAGGATLFERAPPEGTLPSGVVINGLFAFESRGHPLLRLTLDVATAGIENQVTQSVWGMTGPAIFSFLLAMRRLGSIEALLEFTQKSRLEFDLDGKQLLDTEFFCETIADFGRVNEAFEGVRLLSIAEKEALVASDREMPYKKTDIHYLNFKSNIYR